MYYKIDNTCRFCIDKAISHVFLDMDSPPDWKLSTDLFTTVKTIKPDVTFLQLTCNPNSVPVKTLTKQGALALTKPVSFEELYKYLNG